MSRSVVENDYLQMLWLFFETVFLPGEIPLSARNTNCIIVNTFTFVCFIPQNINGNHMRQHSRGALPEAIQEPLPLKLKIGLCEGRY